MLEALYQKFGTSFESENMIFCEYEMGTECFFIIEGKVKITKTTGENQKTLDVIEKGNFFGEMAILETEARSASAIAIGSVRALKFNRQDFDSMIHGYPQFGLRLLIIFCKRIYDAKRRLQIMHIKNPQLRVSDVFLMLAEKDPEYGNSPRIVLNITINDLASWCGLPLEKVQNIVNSFVSRDKIVVYPNKILINNINDFSRLVNYHRKNIDV